MIRPFGLLRLSSDAVDLVSLNGIAFETFIHSLVFSPQAGFSRNQNAVRRPVWPWHTASWANSQGQVAIAFSRLQTFPPSPLGAFKSNDARDLQQRKVEIFVGEKCSHRFRDNVCRIINSYAEDIVTVVMWQTVLAVKQAVCSVKNTTTIHDIGGFLNSRFRAS